MNPYGIFLCVSDGGVCVCCRKEVGGLERVLMESEDLKVTLSEKVSQVDQQKLLTDLINQLQKMRSQIEKEQQLKEVSTPLSLIVRKDTQTQFSVV